MLLCCSLLLYFVIVGLCVLKTNMFIVLLHWPTIHLNPSSHDFMDTQQFYSIDDLKLEVYNMQLSSYLNSLLAFLKTNNLINTKM